MKWRLLDTGFRSGAENMAIDEAVLKGVASGESQPTLRLYQWEPPCLSLGYFQSLETVSRETCRDRGIDVVRRLTGGRTILHHREVTYSIILPEESPLLPEGVIASYEKLSRGLKAALEGLGLNPQLTGRRDRSRDEGASAACFEAPSWYELRVGAKKITGSAQTRRQGVLLQHGSVPYEMDAGLLFSLLDFSSEETRRRACQRFSQRATAINPALRRQGKAGVTSTEIKEALLTGWRETLDLEGEWGQLSQPENRWIKQLKRERYADEGWTGRK